ncbi:iron ABC transporter permease [Gorillibacterium sp. CAU 1737]|uniref:FecCD family ABC transporter permease n=1 Tax=Gorillibacterium sp. CAU 1737 TaxID=3140362 RepID=UPI003261A109
MNRYVSWRNRRGTASVLIEKKALKTIGALCALFLVLFVGSLSVGSTWIPPHRVLLHLFGAGMESDAYVLGTLRLPRLLLGALVGAALGISGLILQGIIRNPLGSPDMLGITGGASAAAVSFLTFLAGTVSLKWLPLAAILGAAVVSLLVYLLSWNKGVTPIRLVLIGIGFSLAMSSLTTMLMLFGTTYSTTEAFLWLTGSVYGASWSDVRAMLPWLIGFLPLAVLFSKSASAQELGDSVATGLGVKVQLHRFALLGISAALAGSAVAYAGGISFVGLIAPHMARRLVGRSFGTLIPVTALVGAMTVFLADVAARTLFLPKDLPAGVFVSAIGAPFFIYLLYRNRHQ